jgi:hypothetical protein
MNQCAHLICRTRIRYRVGTVSCPTPFVAWDGTRLLIVSAASRSDFFGLTPAGDRAEPLRRPRAGTKCAPSRPFLRGDAHCPLRFCPACLHVQMSRASRRAGTNRPSQAARPGCSSRRRRAEANWLCFFTTVFRRTLRNLCATRNLAFTWAGGNWLCFARLPLRRVCDRRGRFGRRFLCQPGLLRRRLHRRVCDESLSCLCPPSVILSAGETSGHGRRCGRDAVGTSPAIPRCFVLLRRTNAGGSATKRRYTPRRRGGRPWWPGHLAQEAQAAQLGHRLVQAVLDPPLVHQQPVEDPAVGEVLHHHPAESRIAVAVGTALGPPFVLSHEWHECPVHPFISTGRRPESRIGYGRALLLLRRRRTSKPGDSASTGRSKRRESPRERAINFVDTCGKLTPWIRNLRPFRQHRP